MTTETTPNIDDRFVICRKGDGFAGFTYSSVFDAIVYEDDEPETFTKARAEQIAGHFYDVRVLSAFAWRAAITAA